MTTPNRSGWWAVWTHTKRFSFVRSLVDVSFDGKHILLDIFLGQPRNWLGHFCERKKSHLFYGGHNIKCSVWYCISENCQLAVSIFLIVKYLSGREGGPDGCYRIPAWCSIISSSVHKNNISTKNWYCIAPCTRQWLEGFIRICMSSRVCLTAPLININFVFSKQAQYMFFVQLPCDRRPVKLDGQSIFSIHVSTISHSILGKPSSSDGRVNGTESGQITFSCA